MNVLVVTTSYPRYAGDAAGSFVATRVAELRAVGARVHVIAAGPASADDVERLDSPLFYRGGAPEAFDRAPAAATLAALGFWGRLVPALAARLSWADRVESHWLVPSALAVAALGGHAGGHRAQAHSGDVALLERVPGGASLARALVRSGARLVFASADLCARFSRLAQLPAVAAAEVSPATSPLVGAPRPRLERAAAAAFAGARGVRTPIVLGVGRLVPIKGYDLLVRAVARLPGPERPALVLLGEGPERACLESLALARGVALHLPGQVPPAEVAGWLASAAVFAHPARQLRDGRTEGTPVAVREALAAGLTVVATDAGGMGQLAAEAATMGNARFTLLQNREGSVDVAALCQALALALRGGPPRSL